ncbi:MAG: hypothetical protein L0J49_01065 [Lactococcus lactis]|nr:hypothetical protein [Lactococcus lactis]
MSILIATILMTSCTPNLMEDKYPEELQEMDSEQNNAEPDIHNDTGDDQSLEPDNEKDG